MTATILANARLFDGVSDEILEPIDVLSVDGVIREIGENLNFPDAHRIDIGRRFLMPGLIDAHYHANTPSYDFYGTDRMPPALLSAHAARLLSGRARSRLHHATRRRRWRARAEAGDRRGGP